jgi:hypothetical protein
MGILYEFRREFSAIEAGPGRDYRGDAEPEPRLSGNTVEFILFVNDLQPGTLSVGADARMLVKGVVLWPSHIRRAMVHLKGAARLGQTGVTARDSVGGIHPSRSREIEGATGPIRRAVLR